jgi:hypothetical protein
MSGHLSEFEIRLERQRQRKAAKSAFERLWGVEFTARCFDMAEQVTPEVPDPELVMAMAIRLMGGEVAELKAKVKALGGQA